MRYTVKPETNGVTGPLFICMPQTIRADERASATESKFYLPAGSARPSVADQVERLWARLFNHGIDTST